MAPLPSTGSLITANDMRNRIMNGNILLRDGRSGIGTIFAVSADNPAACANGGFKEGSTVAHACRQCMATSKDITTEVCGTCKYTVVAEKVTHQ